MRRSAIIASVLLILAALACSGLPTITPTPENPTDTPEPTRTATPTEISPTSTPEPTEEPPTPTPVPPGERVNLLYNPGFEEPFVHPVIYDTAWPEVVVSTGWNPFFCDDNYTLSDCPAPEQGTGNPEGLTMGRPEYKPTDLDTRVHSGNLAQQWFTFFRVGDSGVYQVIPTIPGETYEVGGWFQVWSASNWIPNLGCPDETVSHEPYTSDICTEDDRRNAALYLGYGSGPFVHAFYGVVDWGESFTYPEYAFLDQYLKISRTFVAQSEYTTIFYRNTRVWPFAHNDTYLDDVWVYCLTCETQPEAPQAPLTRDSFPDAPFYPIQPESAPSPIEMSLQAVPTSITEIEREYLANLCVIEARGMGDLRLDACLSVIDTVMLRTETKTLSDGTIAGTITYGCTAESEICQFPAYAVNGCEGILPQACPLNYDRSWAFAAVDSYLEGTRGSCSSYLYYSSRAVEGCRVENTDNGQHLVFTN